jgi:hypothetical protein
MSTQNDTFKQSVLKIKVVVGNLKLYQILKGLDIKNVLDLQEKVNGLIRIK